MMKKKIVIGSCFVWMLVGTLHCNVLPVQAEPTTTSIQIVHTNDTHGYYTTTKSTVGFAKVKTIVDESGADLVLDAGDTYHGQAFATVEKGLSTANLLKEVGYDAITMGNHDWSYGADRLLELETAQGFPILTANVMEGSTPFFSTPYIVKDVVADDGTAIRVGVFGVIDDAVCEALAPYNVEGLTFQEETSRANEIAQTLKTTESCDLVIALTHHNDPEGFVKATKGIDVVLAGHEHLLIDQTYPNADNENVVVEEAGYYFKDVGVLTLTLDPTTKKIVSHSENVYDLENTASVAEDPTVKAKITEIEAEEQPILSSPICTSEQAYPYSWEDVRTQELEVSRIVTAAYLKKSGADVAFENAGGIRGGIPQGNVTMKDIINISPYGNTLVTKKITGAEILTLMEKSIEMMKESNDVYTLQKEALEKGEDPYVYSWPENTGDSLLVSGMHIEYNFDKPNCKLIQSATIGNQDVDPAKEYTIVMNSYAATNSYYGSLATAPIVGEYGTCEQAIIEYVQANNFAEVAKVANVVEQEIVPTPTPTPTPTVTPTPTATSTPIPSVTPTVNPENPATGDTTFTEGFTGIFLVSMSAFGILVVLKRKFS